MHGSARHNARVRCFVLLLPFTVAVCRVAGTGSWLPGCPFVRPSSCLGRCPPPLTFLRPASCGTAQGFACRRFFFDFGREILGSHGGLSLEPAHQQPKAGVGSHTHPPPHLATKRESWAARPQTCRMHCHPTYLRHPLCFLVPAPTACYSCPHFTRLR